MKRAAPALDVATLAEPGARIGMDPHTGAPVVHFDDGFFTAPRRLDAVLELLDRLSRDDYGTDG